MKAPVTPEGLKMYDHLAPEEAAAFAWADPGLHPTFHGRARQEVRDAMPLLARALDRLEDELVYAN